MTEIITTETAPRIIDGEITHIASDATAGVAVETLEEVVRAAARLADTADPFGGRYPSPAEAAGIVEMAPLRHPAPARRGWGKPLAITSMGAVVVGAASGVVAGTAAGPVGICVGGIVGAIAGTARAVHEQNREG